MIVIARIAGRFGEDRAGHVLHQPVVVVDVVAFHLMGRGRRAPQKTLRKIEARHLASFLEVDLLGAEYSSFAKRRQVTAQRLRRMKKMMCEK